MTVNDENAALVAFVMGIAGAVTLIIGTSWVAAAMLVGSAACTWRALEGP